VVEAALPLDLLMKPRVCPRNWLLKVGAAIALDHWTERQSLDMTALMNAVRWPVVWTALLPIVTHVGAK
jgi:hypothetical protein